MKKLVLLCAVLSLILCSCNIIEPEDADFSEIVIPDVKVEPNVQSATTVNNDGIACSTFGRNLLPKELQPDYDKIKRGILNCHKEITLSHKLDSKQLDLIVFMVKCDNPIISWLGQKFSYSDNEIMGTTTLMPEYTMSKDGAEIRKKSMKAKADEILSTMPAFTDDLSKIHFIHDSLIDEIIYDAGEPERSESHAALLKGKATCEGYAKAYQFLLHQEGVESLMVYGTAGGPHAWNLVKINGKYYHSDLTWDDASATASGGDLEYLSHEYMTMNDKQINKSHLVSCPYDEYILPECTSSADNFFVIENLVVTSPDMLSVEPILSTALAEAIDHGHNSVQFICQSDEVFDELNASVIENGVLDAKMHDYLSALQNVELIGKVIKKDANAITYILEYNN